jgi:aminoglycoside phosphotransferase family enzyme/predicted kinase
MSPAKPVSEGLEPLPDELVERLGCAAAYPGDAAASEGVETLQTHISHLFFTRERVYKFRKAVELPFVSFATKELRDADCLREVSLNRRLAPDVYLGVAALRRGASGLEVGPIGEGLEADALEHCVVMRRLRAGCDAQSLLEAGRLSGEHIDRFAERVARFHAEHPLEPPLERDEWYERATQPFFDVVQLARDAGGGDLPADFIGELARQVEKRARGLAHRFEQRRLEGRGVDGHGDLHLQHIWFERDDEPIAMDCVEFRSDLRRMDAAAEVANPAMDLRYRGRPDLAERFLARYAWQRDDFGLYSVVDYFASYRAAVRGGVAAVASVETEISREQRSAAAGSARAHLRLASVLLELHPLGGGLVLMTGTVGSGKSTAAHEIAHALDAVVIGSDRTRKSLAGLALTEHGGPDVYSHAFTERVYAGLLERAAPVVESGRCAVLDATFARRADRARAAQWADAHGLPALLVETRCDPSAAHGRLVERAKGGSALGSESDAGPELLERSIARYEPPNEWPARRRLEADTTAPDWRAKLAASARRWREG